MGILDALRNFGDRSGGKWIRQYRHSTWIDIGEMKLKKQYPQVSYSKESCLQLGSGSLCILRSSDFTKLRNFYFAALVNLDGKFIRIMRIREENMHDKFIDENIFIKDECFNVLFSVNPNIEMHAEEIVKIGKQAGVASSDSWFFQM